MSTETERVDLDGVRARIAKATPGPWEFELTDGKPYNLQVRVFVDEFKSVLNHNGEVHPCVLMKARDGWYPSQENADLIAHAPTDLTALCAEVERLREAVRYAIEQFEPFVEKSPLWYWNGRDFDGALEKLREAVGV